MIEGPKPTALDVRRTIMENPITWLGIDLTKTIFHVCGMDRDGNIIAQRRFRREALQRYLAELPGCRIGMEACGGSHYWARYCRAQGHDARLIAPKFVKGPGEAEQERRAGRERPDTWTQSPLRHADT